MILVLRKNRLTIVCKKSRPYGRLFAGHYHHCYKVQSISLPFIKDLVVTRVMVFLDLLRETQNHAF